LEIVEARSFQGGDADVEGVPFVTGPSLQRNLVMPGDDLSQDRLPRNIGTETLRELHRA
jgi:hypothetical protein